MNNNNNNVDKLDLENSIYLAGSFNNDAREKIIKLAPNKKFINPINNPQSAMYLTNFYDLKAAKTCPAVAGLFPKGKTPGTMTFVELGMAFESQGRIYSAFEDKNINSLEMELINKISRETFNKVEDLGNFLSSHSFLSKPINELEENLSNVKSIFVMGDENDDYYKFIEKLELNNLNNNTDNNNNNNNNNKSKEINYKTNDLFETIKTIKNSDVVALRWDKQYNRENCFLVGVALAHKIPIIIKDASPIPYPPLVGGLQRRTFNSEKAMIEYLVDLEDNIISKEAMIMYKLFPKYNK